MLGKFKSNVRETWRVILVSEADMFLSDSLRILAERLSQSEIGLPLRQICYYSPPEDVGVFSTEIKNDHLKHFLQMTAYPIFAISAITIICCTNFSFFSTFTIPLIVSMASANIFSISLFF